MVTESEVYNGSDGYLVDLQHKYYVHYCPLQAINFNDIRGHHYGNIMYINDISDQYATISF